MFLALREIRRAKVRFGLLIAAVALLAFLILFQSAIQNSLIRQFVGGVRNQTAAVLVFNVDGRRFPQSSTVSPELEEKVRATEGVDAIAPIYQGRSPSKPVATPRRRRCSDTPNPTLAVRAT
ncbi:MAG: hypothetical protein IPG46_14725 [Actinobacteria bacterium]|nr:hypothetical protein [Actinomycetota bacterium]